MSLRREEIEKIIRKNLKKYACNVEIDEKFELIDIGSINFVKFILDIEAIFKIEIEEEKFLVSELSDIQHITDYILEKVKFIEQ